MKKYLQVQTLSSSLDLTHFLLLQLGCVSTHSWKSDLAASVPLMPGKKLDTGSKATLCRSCSLPTLQHQAFYTFVFICWNSRTKLTNLVHETIICRTFQLRLLLQSLPRHRCYNSKLLDQKLLVRSDDRQHQVKWVRFSFISPCWYLPHRRKCSHPFLAAWSNAEFH